MPLLRAVAVSASAPIFPPSQSFLLVYRSHTLRSRARTHTGRGALPKQPMPKDKVKWSAWADEQGGRATRAVAAEKDEGVGGSCRQRRLWRAGSESASQRKKTEADGVGDGGGGGSWSWEGMLESLSAPMVSETGGLVSTNSRVAPEGGATYIGAPGWNAPAEEEFSVEITSCARAHASIRRSSRVARLAARTSRISGSRL